AMERRTWGGVSRLPFSPKKGDIAERICFVCFVQKADFPVSSPSTNTATSRTRRSGVVIGAKRARTTPALSTRNFVKFHFILLPRWWVHSRRHHHETSASPISPCCSGRCRDPGRIGRREGGGLSVTDDYDDRADRTWRRARRAGAHFGRAHDGYTGSEHHRRKHYRCGRHHWYCSRGARRARWLHAQCW